MGTAGKQKRLKRVSVILVLTLVLAGIFSYVPVVQSKATEDMHETAGNENGQESDADATATIEPGVTDSPDVTEEPVSTPEPSATPQASSSPKPSASPIKAPDQIKAVSGVRVVRYSTHSMKVTWKKHKKAKFYRLYYYKKNGNARLAGIIKDTQYIVKKLKNNTNYYFYVVAGKKKKVSDGDSNPSKKIHIKTKTYVHKTIFAGDSICQGIAYGQAFPQMHFKGKKTVIAYRGLIQLLSIQKGYLREGLACRSLFQRNPTGYI